MRVKTQFSQKQKITKKFYYNHDIIAFCSDPARAPHKSLPH